jgi:hypothetical protein
VQGKLRWRRFYMRRQFGLSLFPATSGVLPYRDDLPLLWRIGCLGGFMAWMGENPLGEPGCRRVVTGCVSAGLWSCVLTPRSPLGS